MTWEPDVRLTSDPSGSQTSYDRSIASDSQNRIHVVWYDYRDGNNEIYYKQSPDGGGTWDEDQRLTQESANSYSPSIAVDAHGKIHVIWEDKRDGNYEIYYKHGTEKIWWKVFGPVPR